MKCSSFRICIFAVPRLLRSSGSLFHPVSPFVLSCPRNSPVILSNCSSCHRYFSGWLKNHSLSSLSRYIERSEAADSRGCSKSNLLNFSRSYGSRYSSELVVKPNLVMMKLDTPEFHSLFTPELHALSALFTKYGHELRIAGGAVRDLLAGKVPDDIDFATTATPAQMKEMFTKEDIRMINSNGEAHGTITARINDKENFEVTTLRIDVVTDGRRAQVEFTQDWMLDANRRDLTVNSMFLGLDGTVHDYFNGVEDLKDQRIRFVGDPEQRIQEDYLRILRYFRFFGRLAKGPNDHEQVTVDAIKKNAGGLTRVSGERIWVEMRKILMGRMTASLLEKMIELGLGEHIGLPNATNFAELQTVCERTEGASFNHMTRVSALLDEEADVYQLHQRNKMSNDELSLALFLVKHRRDEMGDDLLAYCTDLHTDTSGKETKVVGKIVELMKYCGKTETAEKFPTMELPQLPVKGHDLPKTVPKGPKFAVTLNELRRIWKESRYTLSKEQLLAKIPEVLENLPQDLKKMRKK
ncbi:CCA tRNA nucleotidyltransferase 1, mitochondrial [Aplysia californica]|uniref:CCA tRNA nucleotidyltransferase 1, mitochondrial n=1 Tax=Aplysia californica TaxID=6500 RepID=A0ABM0K7P5_APLCA|nr:CCA tRNA nucleotidyltransferase 1, mitochondrial [Aplysia californica]